MATGKEIKARLTSINNTKKTTRAMELVSGAKMRKAVEATLSTREYYDTAWAIMNRLRAKADIEPGSDLQRFFNEPENEGKTTIVMFTSNRGLCGGFNSNVVKLVMKEIEKRGKENVEVIGIGKRGVATLSAYGIKVASAYEKDDTARTDDSIRDVMASVHKSFKDGETDRVLIAYTDYKSAVEQNANLVPLFPFGESSPVTENEENVQKDDLYTYEPSEEAVLEFIIPRVAEVVLYQSLLESNASEHSARMIAMKNATDAASEMADDLKLEYNRARQAAITKEIAEIAAGTAAVS
jgi:F-type H+-transporting ATPase subunit gamma